MTRASGLINIRSGGRGPSEEGLEAYLDSLEQAPEGEDMRARDWVILSLTGVIIPTVLLIWGWL